MLLLLKEYGTLHAAQNGPRAASLFVRNAAIPDRCLSPLDLVGRHMFTIGAAQVSAYRSSSDTTWRGDASIRAELIEQLREESADRSSLTSLLESGRSSEGAIDYALCCTILRQ
jgi:hypothetical protein